MTPEQKQRAMQMLRRFSQTTPMTRTADNAAVAMAALLQELVDAPEPEPFGYFKAEPFGWTDCAETDDGAIALFDAPPAPTPAEAPADVARDAELLRKLKHSIGQAMIPGNDWRRELALMNGAIDAAMSEKGGA